MYRANYSRLYLVWMITTFLHGATIFLVGFFPIANYSLENIKEGRPNSLDNMRLIPPNPHYAQTILMLVDALRSDFPTQATMPFSYSSACSKLNIRVDIPTVTMPRLKSLTTGTISNFIDIVLNIGHVEQLSDSLLHRLHERNETAVFAGDRTWKSLFPKQFKRFTANTDSFFVNDFFEGDKNVTEVLSAELERSDWMLLVLHYLGLDHIGHVEGTDSSKIPLKLKEMDDVILKIYKSKRLYSQLLLLTGDHGMKDGGGHGGSTTAEVNVPLFIFKENCGTSSRRSKTYNQIDIAPTLAILWSIDIPPMSIGSLIPEVLLDYSLEDQLYAYYYNALHLMRKATKKLGEIYVNNSALTNWLTTAKTAHKQFLLTKRNENYDNAFFFENAKVNYLWLSREISEQLSKSLVQFDYAWIAIGLTLCTMVVLHTLIVLYVKKKRNFIKGKGFCLSIITIAVCIYNMCYYQGYITSIGPKSTLCLLTALSMIINFILNIANLLWERFYTPFRLHVSLPIQTWSLLGCIAFSILSLASSSFIEMESFTWHYMGASALILLIAQNFYVDIWTYSPLTFETIIDLKLYRPILQTFCKSSTTLLLIAGLILLRHLNVVAFYINKEYGKLRLSILFGAGLLMFLLSLRNQTLVQTRYEFTFYTLAAMLVYCYRSSMGTVLFWFDTSCCAYIFLNIFWFVLGTAVTIGVMSALLNSRNTLSLNSSITLSDGFRVLLNILLTTSVLLHKPHNVFLVGYLISVLSICYQICDKFENKIFYNHKHLQKLLYTIVVGKMFYFYQGNSNSFATIDLNPGYIGQTTYKPIIVGILVTLNMYSAQFISFVFLVMHILHNKNSDKIYELYTNEHINFIMYFYTLTTLVGVLIYFWLLLFFRYHLFIYSVFAPKALYEYYRVVVLFITILTPTCYFSLPRS